MASTQADISARNFGDSAYHSGVRKVSSTVIESSYIGEPPQQDQIRYVEVPVIEDHIEYRKVKEYREVEKRVPKPYYDVVEKIVERPRVVYVDIPREVHQVQEVVKEIKIPRVVDRPVERIIEKVIPRVRQVEQIKEIPQIIEVNKPYEVQQEIEVQRMVNRDVPVIVCQTIKPIITQSDKAIIVDVMDCEPEVIPVDIHVAKPVQSALEAVGRVDSRHKLVSISAAQYNTILRSLNAHLGAGMREKLPYFQEGDKIPFVDDSAALFKIAPLDLQIEGYNKPVMQRPATSSTAPYMTQGLSSVAQPEVMSRGGTANAGDERLPSARLSQAPMHIHHHQDQQQHHEYHTLPRTGEDDVQSQLQRSQQHESNCHHRSGRSRGSHAGSRVGTHHHEHSKGVNGGSSYASQHNVHHHQHDQASRAESQTAASQGIHSDRRHLHRQPQASGRGCACC